MAWTKSFRKFAGWGDFFQLRWRAQEAESTRREASNLPPPHRRSAGEWCGMSGADKLCTISSAFGLHSLTVRPSTRAGGDGWRRCASGLLAAAGIYGRPFDARQNFELSIACGAFDGNSDRFGHWKWPRFDFRRLVEVTSVVHRHHRYANALRWISAERRPSRMLLGGHQCHPVGGRLPSWLLPTLARQRHPICWVTPFRCTENISGRINIYPTIATAIAYCQEHSHRDVDYECDYRMIAAMARV